MWATRAGYTRSLYFSRLTRRKVSDFSYANDSRCRHHALTRQKASPLARDTSLSLLAVKSQRHRLAQRKFRRLTYPAKPTRRRFAQYCSNRCSFAHPASFRLTFYTFQHTLHFNPPPAPLPPPERPRGFGAHLLICTALTARAATSPWPLPSSHPYRALIAPLSRPSTPPLPFFGSQTC